MPEPLLRLALRLVVLLTLLSSIGCATHPPIDDDDTSPSDDDDTSPEWTLPSDVSVRVMKDGLPQAGAMVLQGGVAQHVLTDSDGRAQIELVSIPGDEIWVIAAMEGHRSVGDQLFDDPKGDVVLELVPVEVDNPDFNYAPGGTMDRGTTEYCSHCHITFVDQFKDSAHREAARDHQVHDLFAGVATAFDSSEACAAAGGRWLDGTLPGGGGAGQRCYLGSGLLPDAGDACGGEGQLACDDPTLDPSDAPNTAGACADCHAPATGGPLGGGHSLLDAEGVAYDEGVTCDFCHKVMAIDPTAPPGIGGRTVLGRPFEDSRLGAAEFKPVMYGPLADVLNPFMGGAVSSIFASGEICSGCHEYDQPPLWDGPSAAIDLTRWPDGKLPIHSTWSEWENSLHSPSTPCQACHMPPTGELNSADIEFLGLDPGIAAGFHRGPTSVRDHSFYGPLTERPSMGRLLEQAASVTATASIDGDGVLVEATVTNFGAGHGLPTGEPLRSMLLVVDARCDEETLTQLSGPSLSQVAGALASATVGAGVQVGNASLLWEDISGLEMDTPYRLTAFRPTGSFLDYEGVGRFSTADGGFAPQGKGLPELTPLGSWTAEQTSPGVITLDGLLSLLTDDVLFLTELFEPPTDQAEARMLAGQAGIDFARVLADQTGSWPTPHHRAVDVLRDNRLLPYTSDTRDYRFDKPAGCTNPTATVTLLYRKYPPALARERGWPSLDHVMIELLLSAD